MYAYSCGTQSMMSWCRHLSNAPMKNLAFQQ